PIAGPTLPVFYADRSPSRMGQIIYFDFPSERRTRRETRRGMGEGEYVASANRRVERRVGGSQRRGRSGVDGGTAAGGPAEQTSGSAVGCGFCGRGRGWGGLLAS